VKEDTCLPGHWFDANIYKENDVGRLASLFEPWKENRNQGVAIGGKRRGEQNIIGLSENIWKYIRHYPSEG
jgi:hypothetical protein